MAAHQPRNSVKRQKLCAPIVTFVSLPSDALLRVFSYLASPPEKDDLLLSPSSSSPLLLNNPDSPAATLGQTCCRLHVVYHRAVRLVDVRRAPCACGAPPLLQAFPSAHAVVLNERHVALDSCTDAASLARLRVLGVRCFPSQGSAKKLAEAVPNLRELVLGLPNLSPDFRHDENYLHELQKGMPRFVSRLPPRLTRLSLVGGVGRVQLVGFWDSVSRLEELEELNVSLDLEVNSLAAIRRCRRLQRFSVGYERCDRGRSVGLKDLIAAFLPRLAHFLVFDTHLDLGVADFFRPDMQPLQVEVPSHQGLQTLRIFGCNLFRHLAVLQPVASQLRKLHITTTIARSLGAEGLVPSFPRLEELRLEVDSEIPEIRVHRVQGREDFNGDTLKKLLTSAPVLRMLSLTLRVITSHAAPTFTGKSLAVALRAAASGFSLRSLNFHLDAHLWLPEQFERVAPAIGDQFSELQELDLKNTLATPACLITIGQKLPLLSCLKLGSGKRRVGKPRVAGARHAVRGGGSSAANAGHMATAVVGREGPATKVEHMATEIGSHLARTSSGSLF